MATPRAHARAVTAGSADDRARAVALFQAVRDLPYEADDFEALDTYRPATSSPPATGTAEMPRLYPFVRDGGITRFKAEEAR